MVIEERHENAVSVGTSEYLMSGSDVVAIRFLVDARNGLIHQVDGHRRAVDFLPKIISIRGGYARTSVRWAYRQT